MDTQKRPPFSVLLIALDTLGAVLLGLGFCGLFLSGEWIADLHLQEYGPLLVVCGAALMVPMMLRILQLAIGSRSRGRRVGQ